MNATWTTAETSVLARCFSPSAVRELGRFGRSPLLGRLLSELGRTRPVPNLPTLSSFYGWAFRVLSRRGHRHEYVYKNAIANKVLLGKHSLNTASMLTEFRVGHCKADVVVLNGTSAVYEVKSERDSLRRLQRQLEQYLLVFAYVQVITCEAHLLAVESCIPTEVGIQILSDEYTIKSHRQAINNTARVLPEVIFDSLQRTEYLAVLRKYGIETPDLPNTRIYTAARHLFSSLTPDQAHQGMVDVLKETRSAKPLRQFIGAVPEALKAAALSTPLSRGEQARLMESLSTDLRAVPSWA
jgi:hypothetical protein